MKERIIIGIDPGTNIFGYGIISLKNSNKLCHIDSGVIKLTKYRDHVIKLQNVYEKLQLIIEKYLPDELAIEAPFLGANVQSMLKLGKVLGVVIALSISKRVPIVEYAPKKIKVSISGSSNSNKEIVQRYVKMHLKLEKINKYFDTSDALAVAICHALQKNFQPNKNESWKEFLKQNPNRIL